MIQENNGISGIFVNNIEHTLSQYANNTEFLLAEDRESFESCVTVINNFGRKYGVRVQVMVNMINTRWIRVTEAVRVSFFKFGSYRVTGF